MKAAGRLLATLAIVVSVLLQCHAAPAAGYQLMKPLTSFDVRRRTVCAVVHFPPPDQHIYCCQLTDDCQCPRRMGVCAPETAAAASESSSSSTLSLLKRLFSC